ncbi:Synaptonemal complex protein 2-like [Merluccius polli]|uniref:Synaptonemal complex protein 2-like n=1 Tax=Merluccius polli TaxID=89951 RepID=A0AA47NR11_MERPO|nr:Synaptonemal complex protein 2-like [Merluccius polli]
MTQIGYLRDLLQNYWQDFKVCVLQSCWQEVEGEVVESFTECQQHVSSLLKAVHQHRLLLLQRFQKRVVDHMNQLEDAFKSLSNIETEILNFFRSEVQSLASFCDQQQRRLASLEDKNQEEMTERKNGKEDGEKEERVVIKK